MALKTIGQLRVERSAAAAAWVSAAEALRSAYIDLAAYDQAVCSALVNDGRALAPLTFNAPLDLPQHKEYPLPSWPSQGDKARDRAQVVIYT